MNLHQLISHTRCAILRDTALPTLWSDGELTRYLNYAVKEFATRTHEIVDDTTVPVVRINTIPGQAVYDLHPAIIIVNEVGIVERDDGDEVAYTPLISETRDKLRRDFHSGMPCRYTAQVRTKSIRLAPTPDSVYTLEMVVVRRPLDDMRVSTDEPEISEEYHLALCDYAAYRCLTNNRPEGADMQASAPGFKDLWDLAVRDAKREIAKQRAGEQPVVRTNWTGKRYRTHA